ncbi:MAG: hypothetical protein K9M45_08165 [Kiritimatiellales bacterium]|nr:hypothetical protein [Kiritimatiellales bacterium]
MRGLILPIFLLMVLPLQAEELRLERALALAEKHDARLATHSAATKLAQSRSDAPVQRKNPELRVQSELDSGDPDLGASIRYFPLNPWQVDAEKSENAAAVEEGAAAYRQALLETTIQVTSVFQELQCLEQEKALYGRLAERKKEFADRVDKQLDASVETQGQALLAQWEMHEALENRREADLKAARLKQTLAVLTGHQPGEINVAPLDQKETFAVLDAGKETAIALETRPELQLLRAGLAGADARMSGARAAGIPWLNHLELGYRNHSRGWQLEAAFDLPFFSIGGTDKMLAYEEVTLLGIGIDAQERMVRAEVEAAVETYNLAVREWTLMQGRQIPLIRKTRSYLSGTGADEPLRMQERLALEEKLIDAELQLLGLRRRINQAGEGLVVATGKPVDGQGKTQF